MKNPNHSPSRERVDRYAGPLRSYFRANPFEDRKVFYTLLAVCSATLMLILWSVVPGIKSDRPYSHGPVASVHSSFDSNCEACHKQQSVTSIGIGNLLSPKDRWLDLECQTCHAGPTHHNTMKWPSDWPGDGVAQGAEKKANDADCAACHHDHNGKSFSLTKIDDSHCSKCHTDLPKYHSGGASQYAANIKNFSDPTGSHPEFRKLADEKAKGSTDRKLKFSHSHHMSPGIGYISGGRGKMTKKDLLALNKDDPKIANLYEEKDGVIQLDCASCHQLDAGLKGNGPSSDLLAGLRDTAKQSILPPRAEGAYYLPVNFEAHCQACHPLKSPTVTSSAGQKFDSFDLPHCKQPAEMKEVLRARFSGLLLSEKGRPELLKKLAGDRELETAATEIQDAVEKGFGKLFAAVNPNVPNAMNGGTCTECHKLTGEGAKVESLKIKDPAIPTVWFEHSKFNHISHRGYSCMDCHPNTAPDSYTDRFQTKGKGVFDASKIYTGEDQKINILGVESCRVCHNPKPSVNAVGQPQGGVRSNCTDCHRYHNGDNPFQGRGAIARDPVKPR
jgi:Cytochrome c7 and related cytochrome c